MLQEEIERIKPDLVLAHNIHHYLTYDAIRIARQYTPKVFITMHDVFSFAFHRLNTHRFLESGGKDTTLTPRDHFRAIGFQYNPLRNFFIQRILKKNIKKIIAVSVALEHALHQHHITNTTVIHNGIDTESWTNNPATVHAFKTAHALHDRRIVLFGGRLSLDKGPVPLLQAIIKLQRDIPNILLVVMGDPKRWDECVRSAGIHEDVSNIVRCTGWLHGEDLKTAYLAADIVVVPSLCLDCFPQTNLEAMAAGKPVVGTIFGGTPEAVIDNVTGFLIDPRKTDTFAEKVALLLRNENLRQTMGAAGRKRVEEHFSLSKQVDEYLALFTR